MAKLKTYSKHLGRILGAVRQGKELRRAAFDTDFDIPSGSPEACTSAARIRGAGNPAALLVYGVAQRSGTNFVTPLLGLHPDALACPNNIYEFPFLRLTNHLETFQKEFFADFKRNREVMGENDFLPLFGASIIAHLYSFVDPGQTVIVKEPDVRFLRYARTVFPRENMLLLLRDGRDVLHSAVTTWPDIDFGFHCRRWGDSARLMLAFARRFESDSSIWLTRYEAVLANPGEFAREACTRFGLDPDRFPYDDIAKLPVTGSSSASKSGDEVSWKPVERPKDFKPGGRWQDWPQKWKKMFKKYAGSALIDAGYANNDNW